MKKILNYSAVLALLCLTGFSEQQKTASIILDKSISPQYNKIVFASKRDGNKSIYSMNEDGNDVKKLTNGSDDSEPSWSPDGRHIAFSRFRNLGDGYSEIFIMNADGSNQQRLTHHLLTSNGPVWSPDGKHIAYYIWNRDNWEIFIAPITGEKPRNLTKDSKTQTYPNWSPDGKTIAFHQQEEDGDWNIYTINPDGTNKRRLTSNPTEDWLPAWSPDGETLSFWSTRTGRWEVFLMDADGSNQRQIISNIQPNVNELCPSPWSPDGLELGIMLRARDEDYNIVRFNIASGKFVNLTSSSTKDYCLDWSLSLEKQTQ